MKLQKKIDFYINQFETKKRGEDIITVFIDNPDQKLHDSVFEAHGDRLPTDWIFDKYVEILESMSNYDMDNNDKLDEYRSEIVDGLVDCYTSDLTEWLHDSNYNVYYIEEAQKEFGPIDNGFKMLQMAQYKAIDEIYSYVEKLLTE